MGPIRRRRLFDAEKLQEKNILAAKSGLIKVMSLAACQLRLARLDQGVVKKSPVGDRAGFARHRSLTSHSFQWAAIFTAIRSVCFWNPWRNVKSWEMLALLD
jgi:hypothetical protein